MPSPPAPRIARVSTLPSAGRRARAGLDAQQRIVVVDDQAVSRRSPRST
jgi:hypothetical protein